MRPSASLTTVLGSQYVSETLSGAQVLQIKQLYSQYHKLAVCYGWAYKRLRRVEVSLKMASTVLSVVSAPMTPLSLITLVVSGVGVYVRVYSDSRDLASKVQRYKFTHTLYLKVFDDLRSYLRGHPYDDKIMISDLRVIDQTANDMCLPVSNRLSRRYDKKYSGRVTDIS